MKRKVLKQLTPDQTWPPRCPGSAGSEKDLQVNLGPSLTCGLYYTHIRIINDASTVVRMTIISEATTWSITYDCN